MAKLYWRIKRDSRWTWRPATVIDMGYSVGHRMYTKIVLMDGDEE